MESVFLKSAIAATSNILFILQNVHQLLYVLAAQTV